MDTISFRSGNALESKHTDVLAYLLEQPNELIAEVVQWLDLKDLLSLRITSRKLHELVHGHEEGICAGYCRRLRQEHHALQLPTRIHGLTNDLLFHIELQHRYEPIRQLSLTLSDHIAMKMRLRSPLPEKVGEGPWRVRKRLKLHYNLFPWLFAFNSFLECLKQVFIKGDEAFSCLDDDTYLSMHNIYDLDQQQIIEDLQPDDEETIGHITTAFAILLGVAAAKKLSLNSKSPKYPFASIKRIMIYRGVVPLDGILSQFITDDSKRQKAIIAASERVMNVGGRKTVTYRKPPLRSIRHLDTQRLQASDAPSSRRIDVRNWFVDRQDVWYKAAFAVVQRKGLTQDFPPNNADWIRSMLAEEDDPEFDVGDWNKPDPP